MPPVLPRHARGMDLAAANLKTLAVQKKIVVSDGERVLGRSYVCHGTRSANGVARDARCQKSQLRQFHRIKRLILKAPELR